MRLWYRKPAEQWTQALPLGNGRMGAMVYGQPLREKISLNEDTLWAGGPRDTLVPGAKEGIEKATRLAEEGRLAQAGKVIDEEVLGPYTQSYLPLGDLLMVMEGLDGKTVTDYQRSLDLDTALHRVSFAVEGVTYEQEAFVSAPGQALVVRLKASQPGSLSLRIALDSQLRHNISVEGSLLTLTGLAPSYAAPNYLKDVQEPIVYAEEDDKKGMRFCCQAVVMSDSGTVWNEGEWLAVRGAGWVELRVFAHTSYNGFDHQPYTQGRDERALVAQSRAACADQDYEALKAAHIADYQRYYNRVELHFDAGAEEDLPTDERLRAFQKSQNDPRLYEMLFQYGRYLTICGSRPGTQATNLQGIWNHHLQPPWSSNYTININTEMNYWPTECANLSEMHAPLFDLIDKLRVTGAKTAQAYYGAGGAVSHHNTDIWGLSTPVGEKNPGMYGCCFWNMSFGWLTRHLFEHYEYTLDTNFLQNRAYPAIRDAAQFYLDCLKENEEGYLWMPLATSPENAFVYEGEVTKIARFATMTNAIMREVFGNVLRCCEILQIDADFADRVSAALNRLPPYRIGSQGQMLEWNEEYPEAEVHHRHISHLYPLYPAWEATPECNPTLASACRRSLEIRGDDGTGWSLGWKINAWARLRQGNHALQLLKNQLRLVEDNAKENYSNGGGTYENLFDAHPPFQIDGNFAACAGVCEMLVQSRGQEIDLLPALPDELGTGRVRGLRVKNGLTLDLEFKDGQLVRAAVQSTVPQKRVLRFRCAGKTVEKEVADAGFVLTAADFAGC